MARPPRGSGLARTTLLVETVIRIAAKCLNNQRWLPWRALLFRLHFDGSRRCWVFSGGRMSGYGVMLCLCGFPLVLLGSQLFRIMLEMVFCAFPSLFCRPSSSLRPIQSLTSGRGRSSRPVDRVACWFMKHPIARGNFTVSKTLIKLRIREQSALDLPA